MMRTVLVSICAALILLAALLPAGITFAEKYLLDGMHPLPADLIFPSVESQTVTNQQVYGPRLPREQAQYPPGWRVDL